MDNRELQEDIEKALATGFRMRHQASAAGECLYRLLYLHSTLESKSSKSLLARYRDCVKEAGFLDLLEHQMGYAIRLARSKASLLPEEMFKLFSLADEIHALKVLGFSAPDPVEREYVSSLAERLRSQAAQARHAAEARVDDGNRTLWWYRDTLAGSLSGE